MSSSFHGSFAFAVMRRQTCFGLFSLCFLSAIPALARSVRVVPEGVGVGAVTYSPFEYRRAWDNDRDPHPIGADVVVQVNSMLGAELVDGSYQADYEFFTLDLYAGVTPKTTMHLQIPYFRSEVRQEVDVYAPEPMAGQIRAQLEALDIRDENLTANGWGDTQLWLYHQYKETPRWVCTAGIGWRSQLSASKYGEDTENLNVATRESEAALLNHTIDFDLLANAALNYRLEFQFPLEGRRDIFRAGEGVVEVDHQPGRYMTHELEIRSHWLDKRLVTAAGIWYRDERPSEIDGHKDAHGKDYLWGKLVLGYNGMSDYEKGRLPLPFFVELRYWHLEQARNTRAYFDSYWEVWFAVPLWEM